eukprot:scaffold7921_cov54-Phaeocystis_antarctica.AAC.3
MLREPSTGFAFTAPGCASPSHLCAMRSVAGVLLLFATTRLRQARGGLGQARGGLGLARWAAGAGGGDARGVCGEMKGAAPSCRVPIRQDGCSFGCFLRSTQRFEPATATDAAATDDSLARCFVFSLAASSLKSISPLWSSSISWKRASTTSRGTSVSPS